MWCQVQAKSAISGQGCPLVRSKHAMCYGNDGCVYLYGGKSLLNQTLRDLWRFDTEENQWEQMMMITRINGNNNDNGFTSSNRMCQTCRGSNDAGDDNGVEWRNDSAAADQQHHHHHHHSSSDGCPDSPPPLQEHTIVGYKNKLYVFGGEIGYSSDETPLWTFNLETCVWRKFTINTDQQHSQMNAVARPLGRRAHSAVVYKNIMCIYGGYQDIKGSTSEIWTFNLDTEEWYLEGTNFKKDSSPLPRHGHSAIVYKDSMYIYGGMSNLNVRGDFWSWNFKTKEWCRVKTHRNPGVLSFHSAIVVLDSMFIYGGERSNGNHTNELWRYRFANQSWEHIEIKGIAPSCRTRHVAIANPFLKELERINHQHHHHHQPVKRGSCRVGKQTNVKTETTSSSASRRHRLHCRKQKNPQRIAVQNKGSNTEVDYPETAPTNDENIKSISMCFDQNKFAGSIYDDDGKPETGQSTCLDCMERINPDPNQENGDPNSNNKDDVRTIPKMDNVHNSEDNDNRQTSTTTVRMRPRRPLLQKQRPYSDFYGDPKNKDEFDFANELNEFQFKRRSVQESMSYYSLCFSTPPAHIRQKPSPNPQQQQKQQPNQASPGYSPLAIATIDDSMIPIEVDRFVPKQPEHRSPPPSWETIFEDKTKQDNTANHHHHHPLNNNDDADNNDGDNQFVVKRRENFVSKRRLRKTDLGLLDFTSLALPDAPTSGNNPNGFGALYSLNLDISPDFEKELKFSTDSTPSNQLFSASTDDHFDDDVYESMEMTHLDMLEDYLEPEEMLEIVQESTSGEEISSSLNMKTIPRTPAAIRRKTTMVKTTTKNSDNNKNPSPSEAQDGQQQQQQQQQKQPVRHQQSSSAASVSNSSSGYQSLVLGDSNVNSFDIVSNQSISNSSSFAETHQPPQSSGQQQKNDGHHDFVSKLITGGGGGVSSSFHDSNHSNQPTIEYVELKHFGNGRHSNQHPPKQQQQQQQAKHRIKDNVDTRIIRNTECKTHRSNHLNRLSHWEPNITEVIEEVNTIPCSPAHHHGDDGDDDDDDDDSLSLSYHENDSDNVDDDDTDLDHIDQHHEDFDSDELTLSMIDDGFICRDQQQPTRSSLLMDCSKKNKKNKRKTDHHRHHHNHNHNHHRPNNKNRQHPIFCMYVFGGKEDCITGVLNKQSMTIWKYYN